VIYIDPRLTTRHATRSKSPGLWVQLTLSDGQVVDGTIKNDLLVFEPWKKIEVRFPVTGHQTISDKVTFAPEDVVEIIVLGVIGMGKVRL